MILTVAIVGTLVLGQAVLAACLARALHQRDQARIAAGLARMELREARLRVVELMGRIGGGE